MNHSQHEQIKIIAADINAAEKIIIHTVNGLGDNTISNGDARELLSAVEKIVQIEATKLSLLLAGRM